MKYYCKHHSSIVLEQSKFNKDVLICVKCKEEKNKDRDGIYHIDDLKNMKSNGTHAQGIILTKDESASLIPISEKSQLSENKIVNIYDDPKYDDYDGF